MIDLRKALQIYHYATDYGLSEDILLTFEGLNKNEYENLIRRYLKEQESTETIDTEIDDELYRQYQQANYDEYFDWARTYRYCLF